MNKKFTKQDLTEMIRKTITEMTYTVVSEQKIKKSITAELTKLDDDGKKNLLLTLKSFILNELDILNSQ